MFHTYASSSFPAYLRSSVFVPHLQNSPLPLTCQSSLSSCKCLRACKTPVAKPRTIVVGGGAAGFFCAITLSRLSSTPVTILESSSQVLQKVRISGGGRCNITSALYHDDPLMFSAQYARGAREMPAILSRYGAREVVQFFEREGVTLKTEKSGKIFPVSDSSETVINALVEAAKSNGVKIRTKARVVNVKEGARGFHVVLKSEEFMKAEFVVIATGSARVAYDWAAKLGHTIVPPVPSLFTFRVEDVNLRRLAGVSVQDVAIKLVVNGKERKRIDGLEQRGALLITHWGLSGPAVLSLSAFGARILQEREYNMNCIINWLPKLSTPEIMMILTEARSALGVKNMMTASPLRKFLPARLWKYLVERTDGFRAEQKWAALRNEQIAKLVRSLQEYKLQITGKGEFKEEFVTAGGISLKSINTTTFESKRVSGLYFAGEALDVDGRTGGYNLEFAWSSGHIAGTSIAEKIAKLKPASITML